jgi:hypothetical protein
MWFASQLIFDSRVKVFSNKRSKHLLFICDHIKNTATLVPLRQRLPRILKRLKHLGEGKRCLTGCKKLAQTFRKGPRQREKESEILQDFCWASSAKERTRQPPLPQKMETIAITIHNSKQKRMRSCARPNAVTPSRNNLLQFYKHCKFTSFVLTYIYLGTQFSL